MIWIIYERLPGQWPTTPARWVEVGRVEAPRREAALDEAQRRRLIAPFDNTGHRRAFYGAVPE